MTLSPVKPNDKAVIQRGSSAWGNQREIVTITKVSKTQITTDRGDGYLQRWRADTGRLVGASGYSVPYLHVGTPELLAEVTTEHRKVRLARQLRDTKWETLSLDKLEQVVALL